MNSRFELHIAAIKVIPHFYLPYSFLSSTFLLSIDAVINYAYGWVDIDTPGGIPYEVYTINTIDTIDTTHTIYVNCFLSSCPPHYYYHYHYHHNQYTTNTTNTK